MSIDDTMRQHCEKVLPEKICKAVEKAIQDKGIEISREPKTVIRPEPIMKDNKIVGVKLNVEMKF